MSFYENCIQFCKKEFKFKHGKVKIKLIESEYKSVPEDLLDQFAFVEFNENYSDKNKKRFIAEINIRHEDCESFYKQYPEFYKSTNERFGNFLKYNTGLELSPETNFLLLLLHEYGHIAQLNELYKYNQDISTSFYFDNIIKNTLCIMFKLSELDKYDPIRIAHNFDVSELYADKFALEHFVFIWNKVKNILVY